jgi:catechol 2,3-dioxygenase-like lactoylglutathione lyase family enzyme
MQVITTLPVTDVDRAKAWYADVLQLQPTEITEDGSARYDLENSTLLLYQSRFAGTNQATAAGLVVPDVAAAVADLRARGAVFEEYDFGDDFRTVDGILTMPSGTTLAWVKDPDGNILGLSSR